MLQKFYLFCICRRPLASLHKAQWLSLVTRSEITSNSSGSMVVWLLQESSARIGAAGSVVCKLPSQVWLAWGTALQLPQPRMTYLLPHSLDVRYKQTLSLDLSSIWSCDHCNVLLLTCCHILPMLLVRDLLCGMSVSVATRQVFTALSSPSL